MIAIKSGFLGLLGTVLMGVLVLPAYAQTPSQSGAQDAVITGDNNQVNQVINQTIIYRMGKPKNFKVKDKEEKHRPHQHSNRSAKNSDKKGRL